MPNYGPPTRQIYAGQPGLIPTTDPITRQIYKIGQVGPRTERRWALQHGRYLAGTGGLGSNETQPAYAAKQDSYVESLEKDDDVFGSGIFDSYGRGPTVNAQLGIFADHPSLPGYIDREVQFTVSKDIADITSGADVVIVPGGGLTYQERGGYPVGFDRNGPTPCPPPFRPPPPTAVNQVYASLVGQAQRAPMLMPSPTALAPLVTSVPAPSVAAAAPTPGVSAFAIPGAPPPQPITVLAPPMADLQVHGGYNRPGRMPVGQKVPAGSYPVGQQYNPKRVPHNIIQTPIGSRNISRVADIVQTIPSASGSASMYSSGSASTPSYMPIYQAAPPPPLSAGQASSRRRSLGDDTSPGWGTYAFAGLLIGAASAMVYGAMKGPRR